MGWEEIKVLGKFPYLGCEGRHRGRGRTWKKKKNTKTGLLLGGTVPGGPLETLHKVGALVTSLQEWRTSRSLIPRSLHPEGRWQRVQVRKSQK